MKIVVASDSHGRPDILENIEKWEPDADLYLHCGDLCDEPFYYPNWLFVRGNNDYYADKRVMPNERVLSLEGHKLYMTHSHRCSYSNRKTDLVRLAKENNCDIVLYGHTHVGDDTKKAGIELINPGSCWMNRDGKPASYVVMDLEQGKPPVIEFKYESEWPGHKRKSFFSRFA